MNKILYFKVKNISILFFGKIIKNEKKCFYFLRDKGIFSALRVFAVCLSVSETHTHTYTHTPYHVCTGQQHVPCEKAPGD